MAFSFRNRVAACLSLALVLAGCSSPKPAPVPPQPEQPLSAAALSELRKPAMGDLDAILKRGVLRILVTASPTNYYVEGGVQGGAAYSAALALEAYLRDATGARSLTVAVLPVATADLITALNEGRGDLVANIVITPDREEPTVTLVPALTNIREVVATAPGQPRFLSLEDLEGRSIYVRKSGPHFASLERINRRLAQINKPGGTVVAADESLSDEELLAKVAAAELPATLVDSHVAALWKPVLNGISINDEVAVSQDAVVAWAVRKDSPALLQQLNAFAKAKGPAVLFGTFEVQKATQASTRAAR